MFQQLCGWGIRGNSDFLNALSKEAETLRGGPYFPESFLSHLDIFARHGTRKKGSRGNKVRVNVSATLLLWKKGQRDALNVFKPGSSNTEMTGPLFPGTLAVFQQLCYWGNREIYGPSQCF